MAQSQALLAPYSALQLPKGLQHLHKQEYKSLLTHARGHIDACWSRYIQQRVGRDGMGWRRVDQAQEGGRIGGVSTGRVLSPLLRHDPSTWTCASHRAGSGPSWPVVAAWAYPKAKGQMSHYPKKTSSSWKFLHGKFLQATLCSLPWHCCINMWKCMYS